MKLRKPIALPFPSSRWVKLGEYYLTSPLLHRVRAARLLVETKMSYATLAQETGVEARTLAYWAQQIALGRLINVIQPKGGRQGGRLAKLPMQVQQILSARLRVNPRRSARDIRLWLKDYHSIELSPQALNYWIIKLLGEKRERRRKGAKTDVITGSDSAPKLTKEA